MNAPATGPEAEGARDEETEEAVRLHRQHSLLEAAYRAAPVGLAVIDAQLRFLRINERLAEMNGASVEAHIGRTVQEMLPDITAQGEAALRRVLETGEALRDVEISGETPAQPGVQRIWIEQFLPLRDGSGAVIGVNVVTQEVTAERKALAARDRAERQLRESEQRLALALEAGQLGFWDWHSPRGRVTNGGCWAAMLGHALDEIAPEVVSWRSRVHPDDLQHALGAVNAHLDGQTPFYEFEHRMRTRDGDWIWVLDRGQVVERDALGRAVRAIGTHLDVSERHRSFEALRDADRRKDEFIAMLGHELRNPLSPLTNALRLLASDPAIEGHSERALAIARRQVGHLRRLVEDLLDVSRITLGRITLQPEWLDVAAVMQAAIETAQPGCDARRQRLGIAGVDPGLQVRADPVRLAQALDNLLHNACKYTPEGGEIRLSARADGAMAEIRVADTGIGIAPDDLESVFELFSQGEPGVDLADGGLGIGLALVRRLISLHGGTVHAESAGRHQGTTIVLRLPRD